MGFLDNAGLGTLWKNIVGKSIPYGYCTTGASTRAKTVTVSPAITELTAGVQILVKFQYANTASTTSSAVTLNVNGLGAKDIKRYGSTNISNSAATSWNANSVVLLTYDGSYWQLTDYNNTTYSGMTDAEVNAGTSGTNRLITPARLKYAIQHWSTGEANVQSDWSQTDDTADDFIKNKPTVPAKTSELTNDSGFITEEADPTVPAWAKASTKPTYTASEIRYNAQVTVAQEFNNKVDKVSGKGLSTNDYTTAEQTKLAGIATGAEVNVNADWNATSGDAQILNKPTIPSKTSDLTNDSGFITGYTETDPVFTASPAYGITAQNITSWNNKVNKSGDIGLGDMMFQTGSGIGLKFQSDNVDKVVRLNGFGGAAGYNLYFRGFDVGVSGNNPVSLLNIADPTLEQGAATKKYVDDNKFSGSYNDLTNKPTIPTKTSDLTNDSGFITSFTETDPIFTASPAHGITEQQISDWNSKPSLITVLETGKNAFVLNVNGSTATLIDYKTGNAANFLTVFLEYTNIQDCFFGQVINGASNLEQAQARLYELAELDMTTQSLRLVSVDNGVIYTADLQDTGDGLTGTFSSQTIPTGGITTETDPTVPAWAKASSKPSYGADEISFDNTQQTQYLGNATNVNTALTSLDFALDNAEHDINNISSDYFSKSGGTIKGDVTLYVASGNSPAIIFQRGTLTDNYNDWKIYDKSGFLYFAQRGSGSSAFGDMGYIDTGGVLRGFTIPWGSVSGKPTQLPTVTSSDNGKVLRVVDGAWSAVSLPSASGVSF